MQTLDAAELERNNGKRIAKNTLLLYSRNLLLMLVNLYTSRVILNALGVEDFGIYNVVGGVVSLFSILSGSLSAAISRFITFELGKNNQDRLARIFTTAVNVQLLLAAIALLLAESVGIWFLNAKMNIPASRMGAANWVFQFSLLAFLVNLVSVPYNALITAHEKMAAFAYISIIEGVGKLTIAFLAGLAPIDKLSFYAILMFCLSFVVRLIYGWYCKRNFSECSYSFCFDKELMKRMFGFAGWNFIGASSAVLRDGGGNVVINLFCGPAVNAARGVASQVNNAITQFSTNFMTALNPQITKSYASGNRDFMMLLMFRGAKLSFFLLLFISLPVIFNTQLILSVWLMKIPNHTALFIQLVLVFAMSESVSGPLVTAMLATGEIRNYQLVVGGLQMLNLPISYLFLRNGFMPETVVFVAIGISQCCFFARLFMLRNMIKLDARLYLKVVYLRIIAVSIVAVAPPWIVSELVAGRLLQFVSVCLVSVFSCAVAIYWVGCDDREREIVVAALKALNAKRRGI